ncbi:unnamed protein product [Ceratitis capitata]|uniref:(Mediterranean fruit fly) hypothetical protein n=1 Tax=Ceratitis capitata TaxID=7213 RepID=A0A811UHK9_CERCA|nr:unnamed protein product [Ceratitis capitata]
MQLHIPNFPVALKYSYSCCQSVYSPLEVLARCVRCAEVFWYLPWKCKEKSLQNNKTATALLLTFTRITASKIEGSNNNNNCKDNTDNTKEDKHFVTLCKNNNQGLTCAFFFNVAYAPSSEVD